VLGLGKFYHAIWEHGVRSVILLADLDSSDCAKLGLTPFQLKALHKLAADASRSHDDGESVGEGEGSLDPDEEDLYAARGLLYKKVTGSDGTTEWVKAGAGTARLVR
jgi:hypothetical protein